MEAQSATKWPTPTDNLTPKQTAALLNLPEATLSVWRCTNRVVLPFFKLGHHVRYRRSDIERFINGNLRNVAPAEPAVTAPGPDPERKRGV